MSTDHPECGNTLLQGILMYKILGCQKGQDPKFGFFCDLCHFLGLRRQSGVTAAVIDSQNTL
jgi:hypothetical protein